MNKRMIQKSGVRFYRTKVSLNATDGPPLPQGFNSGHVMQLAYGSPSRAGFGLTGKDGFSDVQVIAMSDAWKRLRPFIEPWFMVRELKNQAYVMPWAFWMFDALEVYNVDFTKSEKTVLEDTGLIDQVRPKYEYLGGGFDELLKVTHEYWLKHNGKDEIIPVISSGVKRIDWT